MIGNKNKKFDANSIPYSQAVTHPGTNGTRRCLDFGELTRPGAFSVVWPLTPTHCSTQTKVQLQLYYSYLSLIYIYRGRPDPRLLPLLPSSIYSLSATKSTVAILLLVLVCYIYTAAAPTRAFYPYYRVVYIVSHRLKVQLQDFTTRTFVCYTPRPPRPAHLSPTN